MRLTDADKQRWNDFVAAQPAGDVLQAWEWGELKARTGWQPYRFAVAEGERLVAGAQVLQRPLPGGRSLLYAPRGPLVAEGYLAALSDLITEIRTHARQVGGLALKVDPAIADGDAEWSAALAREGFRLSPASATGFGGVQPRYVMKVDLRDTEEELLASFHPKWRYNLRLAERKGVTIAADCCREDMALFYEVLQETAARDGFGIRAVSYFYDLWDLLLARGLGRLFLGRLEGEIICGAITLALGPQAWYIYGASSNRHRNVMPNHLLQWEMMRWARAQGCRVYDMRGVAREASGEAEDALHGLNRFKRGFGAVYSEYVGEYDLVFAPLWYRVYNVAEATVRALRRRRRGGSHAPGE
jgi:lipid II:glycine glycyltransferase (peptidoglycan interpeptide bridge formation enzyme)